MDVVDLEDQGQGPDPSGAGDPKEPLEVGVLEEVIAEESLHLADLLAEELDLVLEEAGLEEGEGRLYFSRTREMEFFAPTRRWTRRRRVLKRSR